MPSLMKARSGVLNSNIGGNALAPLFSTGALTIANAITDVTRLAGVEGDGATYPASMVGVWPAATNLCANGGFETNTTGWGARGSPNGPSIARTTAESKFGGASLAVTIGTGYQSDWGAAFDNSSNYIAVTGGSTYTLSVWVKSNGSNTVTLRVFERDGAKATIGIPVNGAGSTSSGWVKLVLTATANASAAYWQIIVGVGSAADVSFTYYLDGVQLETGSIATPYIETDGGTASRSAGLITIPAAALNSPQQMWFAARMKMGFSQASPPNPGTAMFWSQRDSANEGLLAYYNAGTCYMRRDSGGSGTAAGVAATGLWSVGDDITVIGATTSALMKISFKGAAFTTAANTTIPTLTGASRLGTDAVTPGREPASAYYWFAAGKGTLTDADAALFNAWGNNDPLPHMFPRSAQLTFLARFNGDGTAYRYAA